MTEAPAWRVIVGDARERLAELEPESVQTCVTSPPYFGLRDYGTGSWVGGDPGCDHRTPRQSNRSSSSSLQSAQPEASNIATWRTCGKCGARRVDAQIGLEESPAEYVAELVAVFDAVRRVLRPDGTLWLNLGDSYATSPPGGIGASSGLTRPERQAEAHAGRRERLGASRRHWPGIKPKDLLMIPATVALALRAAGWYLRQEVVWAKTAPMPESVSDRCTRSHEVVYMLAKSPRYFYDAEAIAEPSVAERPSGNGFDRPHRIGRRETSTSSEWLGSGQPMRNARDVWTLDADERAELEQLRAWRADVLAGSRSDVWTLGPEPSDVPHFAVMPSELARRCILAGSSSRACAACGAPWRRLLERGEVLSTGGSMTGARASNLDVVSPNGQTPANAFNTGAFVHREAVTVGFEPSCGCGAEPGRCVVLDPFAGVGTTGRVALGLGREFVGVELSAKYAAIAEQRLGGVTSPLFAL